MNEVEIKSEVRSRYAGIAMQTRGCCSSERNASSCCSGGGSSSGCCGSVASLQEEPTVTTADLGLSCGLPTQYAGIRPGDTVLDLGSGAGVDVFRAAGIIGSDGRAIGVDMTPEMIARARENAARSGVTNVEFRLGEIEALPVEAGTVDVVLSNCVINLVPDKKRAFQEILRVLKPGGHFTISDIVTYGDVPDAIRQDMALWAGCVAGALDREAYLEIIRETGFSNVQVDQFIEYDSTQGQGYGLASMTVEAWKG